VSRACEGASGSAGRLEFTSRCEVARWIAELPVDREIVAYCRGPFCAYAHQAVRTLNTRAGAPSACARAGPSGSSQHGAPRSPRSAPSADRGPDDNDLAGIDRSRRPRSTDSEAPPGSPPSFETRVAAAVIEKRQDPELGERAGFRGSAAVREAQSDRPQTLPRARSNHLEDVGTRIARTSRLTQ
jgi:hypothetical protein